MWKLLAGMMVIATLLLSACVEKKKNTAAVSPVSQWPTDSVALQKAFDAWVQKLLPLSEQECLAKAENLIADETENPQTQLRLARLAELYFNDPNSPYRNEAIFISVLEALIESPDIDSIDKVRPRFLLEKAMMNRSGTLSADISLHSVQGKQLRLHDVDGEYILLYFFNPECHDCKRVAQYITASPVFLSFQNQKLLKVVAVYPDEDLGAWERHKNEMPATWITARTDADDIIKAYDLPAIPNLYLLDKDKRVILKDAPIEHIEHWIIHNR